MDDGVDAFRVVEFTEIHGIYMIGLVQDFTSIAQVIGGSAGLPSEGQPRKTARGPREVRSGCGMERTRFCGRGSVHPARPPH